MFFRHKELIHPEVPDGINIKTLYNFAFRLSGNLKIAEILTEKALLGGLNDGTDDALLLKEAWESFRQYYGHVNFQSDDPTQQALLNLSPELRCALILRDVLGYPYGRIAKILNADKSEAADLIKLGRREIYNRR